MWKCKNVDRKQNWKDNPSKAEVIQRLDSYRAIEIGNLWQRSVFLATFLLLGYTGYGILLDKMVCGDCDLPLFHFVVCVLACVNIVLSILWIAMAKGSKAWYEVYENAITFVENSDKALSWKEVRWEIDLRRRKSHKMDKACENRNAVNFENKKNDSLLSTNAGGYSPSKINIALGQISFVIWVVVLFIHVIFFAFSSYVDLQYKLVVFLIYFISIFTLIMIGIFVFTKWIKSSYFSD